MRTHLICVGLLLGISACDWKGRFDPTDGRLGVGIHDAIFRVHANSRFELILTDKSGACQRLEQARIEPYENKLTLWRDGVNTPGEYTLEPDAGTVGGGRIENTDRSCHDSSPILVRGGTLNITALDPTENGIATGTFSLSLLEDRPAWLMDGANTTPAEGTGTGEFRATYCPYAKPLIWPDACK